MWNTSSLLGVENYWIPVKDSEKWFGARAFTVPWSWTQNTFINIQFQFTNHGSPNNRDGANEHRKHHLKLLMLTAPYKTTSSSKIEHYIEEQFVEYPVGYFKTLLKQIPKRWCALSHVHKPNLYIIPKHKMRRGCGALQSIIQNDLPATNYYLKNKRPWNLTEKCGPGADKMGQLKGVNKIVLWLVCSDQPLHTCLQKLHFPENKDGWFTIWIDHKGLMYICVTKADRCCL